MIEKIKNIHKGKSIAVLGSSPSVELYNQKEDFAIGVNGAGELLSINDYFLSGDEQAHQRLWFKELSNDITCILRAHSAIYVDRFYPNQESSQSIKEYETHMDNFPNEVITRSDGFRFLPSWQNTFMFDFLKEVPDPVSSHLIIRNISREEIIGRNQKYLNTGGTSAAMAMQTAYLMGAKEIHLYGVEFSNPSGNNYFNNKSLGLTTDSQRKNMDEMIFQTKNAGVKVYSHGPTNLENSIKVDK